LILITGSLFVVAEALLFFGKTICGGE